ncbi:MAG: Wzz/FepE/Etk N-terminal domain-containing protein [Bacteroidales bacterium]|nr:Wzz/FepE/Etk N-terminal domain-containing protein [Bacteroidales bacterium]MCM1146580.1 Wzz/FepE/Etk N-terminal domain-containing protein [Bacteroidales bacterium]MCM1205972.1 Wzz/FepE/Etk N-terminal domain-containing protein [Bacillota bacterium]MCM1510147.1 Wzz/FepE/Etk N-terminal domain-containing protein [Clostridium sp.]
MEKAKETKEIDIIALTTTVLKDRKSLTISVIAGIILGLIIAFSSPKTYTADVVLAPELSAGGIGLSGNIADMASQFGIDIGKAGKSMDAIYPEIYPEILTSNDFVHKLFTVPVRLKNDDTERTYFEHLTRDTKIPFWQYPKIWITEALKPKDPVGNGKGKVDRFKVSRLDEEMCKAISLSIGCTVDKKTSVITITVTDQDPLVAAIMADTLQQRLQNYITTYRTKKACNDLEYYTKLHAEAKEKYQKAQNAYANYCDANQDVLLESYIAKRDELENEMQSAFTVMNQMSIQMNSAQAKIQARTPAYTIIKSAKMPYKPSSMSKIMILILTVFFAVMADAAWVLVIKDFLMKKKI